MHTALSVWLSWPEVKDTASKKQREPAEVVQSHNYSHCCNRMQPNRVLSEVLLVLRSSKINENLHLVSLHQPSPANPPPAILIKSLLATFPPPQKAKIKKEEELTYGSRRKELCKDASAVQKELQ